MAVEVKTGTSSVDRFAKADGIYVKDGHLHVTAWNGANDQTVAIFVPATWRNAKVTEETNS